MVMGTHLGGETTLPAAAALLLTAVFWSDSRWCGGGDQCGCTTPPGVACVVRIVTAAVDPNVAGTEQKASSSCNVGQESSYTRARSELRLTSQKRGGLGRMRSLC